MLCDPRSSCSCGGVLKHEEEDGFTSTITGTLERLQKTFQIFVERFDVFFFFHETQTWSFGGCVGVWWYT
jgi:hypothetical protein